MFLTYVVTTIVIAANGMWTLDVAHGVAIEKTVRQIMSATRVSPIA